jgi:hypothetical protein
MAGAPEGNTNRATQYRIKRTLEAMWEKHKGSAGVDLLEKACEAQLLKAAEGDLASFREVADRLDGKPSQTIDANVTGSLAGILSAIPPGNDPPLEA